MPRTNPEARQRLVATAADMLRRRGLKATSIRELAKEAKTPLGSTYHYFPRGRQQVVAEALQFATDHVSQALSESLQNDPLAGVQDFLSLVRKTLIDSKFNAGCPILAVSTEQPVSDEDFAAIDLAAKAFAAWEALLASAFRRHGLKRIQARQIATLILAAMEGAMVMSRATRSITPFDRVTSQLDSLLSGAFAR